MIKRKKNAGGDAGFLTSTAQMIGSTLGELVAKTGLAHAETAKKPKSKAKAAPAAKAKKPAVKKVAAKTTTKKKGRTKKS